jgi:MFS family permease
MCPEGPAEVSRTPDTEARVEPAQLVGDASAAVTLNGGAVTAGAVTARRVTEAPERSLRRIVQALRYPDFRLFWAGNFLSNIGTWMQNVAQGWLVLELTNSATWLGLVGFASTIPILFLACIGGVIADHVNNRKLLIVTQSVMMFSAFMMAALMWIPHQMTAHRVLWLALLTGLAMSLNTPSYQALVPQLVPREDLVNAIALNSAQFNMSRVIGPMLGSFAMALVGKAGNFFLNGLSFLAVIIALTRIKYPHRGQPREGDLWEKMKEGIAYVFKHEHMSPLVALTAIASILAIPYLVFVPYFARNILHAGERGLGVLMACSGIGAFIGAVNIAYTGMMRRRGLVVVRFGVAFYSAIILFTFSRYFWISAVFLAAAGYAMVLMIATINALLQHLAEESMRGRVMSIYSTAFLGMPPIGSLIAALLSRSITPAHAIAAMSALALLGTWAVFVRNDALRDLD